MKKILRKIRNLYFTMGFEYARLVEIIIYKKNIVHNLETFQKLTPNLKIAPVLKSNAYGHGLKEIAQIVDKKNIAFIVVDSYAEALLLKNEAITSDILIIGYTACKNIFETRIKKTAFTITSLDQLKEISSKLEKVRDFHLMIDTGMNRQGIRIEEIDQAILFIQNNKYINLQGICSHLADGENENTKPTDKQIEKWNNSVKLFKKHFPSLSYWHLSATSGFFHAQKIQANVARLGIGLYGYHVNAKRDKNLNLLPALEMRSVISAVKKIKKSEGIGYNFTFEAKEDMTIATIPAGYFEGIDPRLSNKGFVKVGEEFCPIIGRVSMDITIIDVTSAPLAKRDMQITLVSSQPEDKNSVKNITALCQTIPYEILVHIPYQLKRVIL